MFLPPIFAANDRSASRALPSAEKVNSLALRIVS
jgi:hypothetical protein